MAQQTIKALYSQPITYKLIKDGYKTVTETFSARDGMPKVMELDPPAETYTTDMTYTTDNTQECATLVTFSKFTTPDDSSVPSKTYVCAPANTSYACPVPTEVKTYNNFTVVGSPTINTSTGIVSGFANGNYLTFTTESTTLTSFEIQMKIQTNANDQEASRPLNSISSYGDTVNGFYIERGISSKRIALIYYTGSQYYNFNAKDNVENGKFYLLKWVWDGNTVKSYYSESDEEHFVLNSEVEHTSFPVAAWSYSMGVRTSDPNYTLFNGSIDLSKTYIKYNNDYIWRPYTTSTEIQTQYIPGLLDASTGNYDPTQATEYKLYQLHRGENNDVLRLTNSTLTAPNSLYNQYISQVTLPTQTLKWYYKGEPQSMDTMFYNTGCIISSDHIASGFGPEAMLNLMLYGDSGSYCSFVLNIETGDMLQDCGMFSYVNYYSGQSGVYLGLQNKFDGGKLLLNSRHSTSFTNGVTTLQPNTKYWIGISKNPIAAQIYILQDNGTYTKETLPDYTSWSREGMIPLTPSTQDYGWEGTFGSLGITGAKVYDSEGTLISSEGTFYFAGGKLYLDNTYQNYGPYPSYSQVMWEPYRYYNYKYWWCTNKSIYTYLEHENFADYLDFTNSYVNVTDNSYHKYLTPTVCLMPMTGGDPVTKYSFNGAVIGSPTIDSTTGIASGFNNTNYLKMSQAFLPEDKTWEVIIKAKTPVAPDTQHYLMGSLNSYYYTIGGELMADNKFGFGITSNGEAWDIAWLAGTTVTTPDTWYWIKLSFTGTVYKFELSTDGETYNLEASVESSTPIYQNSTNSIIALGTQAQHYTTWNGGSIDLTQCQIKINNTVWWNGANSNIEYKYLYQTQGEAVDYTNFANLPQTFIDGSNFEIVSGTIRNGSKSYKVGSGYSYGYFKLTPTQNITVSVTAQISSESGWDYAACYIGTQQYQATREQIKAKTTDGNGSWLFANAGAIASTEYSTTLEANTTYYVQFYYAKDSAYDSNDDRVYITALTGFTGVSSDTFSAVGCIASGSTDDGTEQDWDVYYPANYSQPILVNAGQTYTGGTKVDTITLPAHKTWDYTAGGTWTQRTNSGSEIEISGGGSGGTR